MSYCGWPNHVNKIILDSTTITVGEGATVHEGLESGGLEKTRLICSNPPDKYNVTMAFDFSEKKYNGYTELDLFWAWYKTVHKFGTVPFQFPAILLNSNRQEGYSQEDIGYGNIPRTEYYCITSPVEGIKSGLSQQITMTWATYATGVMQAKEEDFGVDHIEAENGQVKVVLTATSSDPSYEPDSSTWAVFCTPPSGVPYQLTITNCIFDGTATAILFFDEITDGGTYRIRIGNKTSDFVVVK